MPVFMALWLPLIRGTFTKPALIAEQHAAREGQLRHRLQPPSVMARAP